MTGSGVGGHVGALRVSYQTAATIVDWTLTLEPRLPRRYRLTGTVTTRSDYWLAQRPLMLVLEVGPETWTWMDVTPEMVGARVGLWLTGRPQVRGPSPTVRGGTAWAVSGQ